MIADTQNKYISLFNKPRKKLITPSLRALRALFFLFLFSLKTPAVDAESMNADSLIRWVNEHPKNDSIRIQRMHTISYVLSETNVPLYFVYYGMVSRLSDSLHFT